MKSNHRKFEEFKDTLNNETQSFARAKTTKVHRKEQELF